MKDLEILLTLLAAIAIALTSKWKKSNAIAKALVIITIAIALSVAINTFIKNKKEDLLEKITASFGEISDETEVPVAKMEIDNGGSIFTLSKAGVFGIKPEFDDLFKLYVKSNKLFINAIIRDRKGDVIAAIYQNEWTWYKKGYEYNNDNNAFEIVTQGDRKVFFNVDLQKGIAHMTGFFYNDNGYGLEFYHEAGREYSILFRIRPSTKEVDIPKNTENAIFKYPREKYVGVRN